MKVLLEYKADVNSQTGWALQTAAANGHIEIVDLLLSHGADVNAHTTHEGMKQGTALQAAVEASNETIVDLLLQRGANPNLGGGELTCPIIAASKKGEKEILELLIKAKVDVDVCGGPYNASPLTYAAMSLPQSSILSLLDAGADINLADEDGDTALTIASLFGDAEIVQCLLDRGADVLHRNHDGKNALQVALESDKSECVNILVAHISEIMEALRVAVESGDAAVTAVIRTVESRKQGLDYDESSLPAHTDISGTQRGYYSKTETGESAPIKEHLNLTLDAPRSRDVHQSSVGVIAYDSASTELPKDDRANRRDAAGTTMTALPDTMSLSRNELQRNTSQPHPSWDPPPLRSEHQSFPFSSGPIRRKPIASPEHHENLRPPASETHFAIRQGQPMKQTPPLDAQRIQQPMATPVHPMVPSYQALSRHQLRQPLETPEQNFHARQTENTQWNQYRAYKPTHHDYDHHQQQQRSVSYGDNRDSSQNPIRPQPQSVPYISGVPAGYHRNSPEAHPGQHSERPQELSSKPSFFNRWIRDH